MHQPSALAGSCALSMGTQHETGSPGNKRQRSQNAGLAGSMHKMMCSLPRRRSQKGVAGAAREPCSAAVLAAWCWLSAKAAISSGVNRLGTSPATPLQQCIGHACVAV